MAYETPDYLKEYLETASDPFGRSGLGDYLHNKEQRLRKQTDINEQEEYWQNSMNQVTPTGEEIPNPDILMNEDLNWKEVGDAAKGWTSYLKYPAMKGLLAKLGPKLGAKAATKVAGYTFGGPAGWAMGAADLVDYFGYPIYDHVPGGDYLSWRDTSEGEEE